MISEIRIGFRWQHASALRLCRMRRNDMAVLNDDQGGAVRLLIDVCFDQPFLLHGAQAQIRFPKGTDEASARRTGLDVVFGWKGREQQGAVQNDFLGLRIKRKESELASLRGGGLALCAGGLVAPATSMGHRR